MVPLNYVHVNGIKVLKSKSPLLSTTFAEVMNSSLDSLDRFTICARFFPYQFIDTFKYHQEILSTDNRTTLFGTTTTGNCIKTGFVGCTEYYKKFIGDTWKYGKA